MEALRLERLSFSYRANAPIFQDFSLAIGRDERWSIIGPSGCGKTTLLYLLAELLPLSGGRIRRSREEAPSGVATGLVLQDYGLLPWATAAQNISLGMKIQKVEKKTIARITEGWLKELGLENVADHYPAEMSGGQRQRVAIARTLALDPALLLLDEPFASLDSLTREDLLDLVKGLVKRANATALLVTHNIAEALVWGHKILVLNPAPNRLPTLFHNPRCDADNYRESADFALQSQELRGLINGFAGNVLAEARA
jgi:ABC-type nitrate/sulfonate/bicarbonate transport system ATPase subunit